MNNSSTNSFENQTVYIGIDVHKNSWHVTERHCGLKVKSYSASPKPELLIERLKSKYPGATYKSVYEAGFCGFWIHKQLVAAGIDNIVINPADVPTSGKERIYKNDAIDSAKLARELEYGNLSPIYIPTDENLVLRDLVRHETQIVGNVTRCKNRIKSYFALYGITLTSWSSQNIKKIETLANQSSNEALKSYLRELRFFREERIRIAKAEKKYLKNLKKNDIHNNLCTIPGIGFRSAIILQAELWDIQRFKDDKALNAYVGFAPRIVGSGDSEQTKGNCGRKKIQLHYILIEVAWRAIRLDMDLRALYGRHSAKTNSANAISIIAKKILARIRVIMLQNRPYIIRS